MIANDFDIVVFPQSDDLHNSITTYECQIVGGIVVTCNFVETLRVTGSVAFRARGRNSDGAGPWSDNLALPCSNCVSPIFGTLTSATATRHSVSDQTYKVGEAVSLQLPAANLSGGAYTLSTTVPAGLTFDAATRRISGTPTTAQSATEYTYTFTSSSGRTATRVFDITVEADTAPAFDSTYRPPSILVGDIVNETLPSASGGDGDLVYSLSPAPPPGLTFDSSTRKLSGTATTERAAAVYTYKVADEDGDSATQTFNLTVGRFVNEVPDFGSATIPDQTFVISTPVNLTLPQATGGNGNLRYSLPNPPSGLTFNSSTRTLSGTPTLTQPARPYTYTVNDGDGDTSPTDRDELTFNITVVPEGDSGSEEGSEPLPPPPAIKPQRVSSGESTALNVTGSFRIPDGAAVDWSAASTAPDVTEVGIDQGGNLTLHGLNRGRARVTVTAEPHGGRPSSQGFWLTVDGPASIPHFPSSGPNEGLVRVINHSRVDGEVVVRAVDDGGVEVEPVRLAVGARSARHFTAADLEAMRGPPSTGSWRLELRSGLDFDALPYARTRDGFLSELRDVAARGNGAYRLSMFNPASNLDQVSLLRLVNDSAEDAEVTVTGVDDAGLSPGEPVRLTVPAGTACTVDAAQLESGSGLACGPPQDGLGDGAGKWRLSVASEGRLAVMGLLAAASGHVSNLSGPPIRPSRDGSHHVLMFPSASDPFMRQGLVRVRNRSGFDGSVEIQAFDGSGWTHDTVTMTVGAGETVQFNSNDLELGNAAKGLDGGTGPGLGDWRLKLRSGADLEVSSYVRSSDGLASRMHRSTPRIDGRHLVALFNPAGNDPQASLLRLVNEGGRDAWVHIAGIDDDGTSSRLRKVYVTVPAGRALNLSAGELESGSGEGITSGALGDGSGKWRLLVGPSGDMAVMSLLPGPAGRLANVSTAAPTVHF